MNVYRGKDPNMLHYPLQTGVVRYPYLSLTQYENVGDPGFLKQDPDVALAESVSVPKPGFLRPKYG